jgi:hypothetical protein
LHGAAYLPHPLRNSFHFVRNLLGGGRNFLHGA